MKANLKTAEIIARLKEIAEEEQQLATDPEPVDSTPAEVEIVETGGQAEEGQTLSVAEALAGGVATEDAIAEVSRLEKRHRRAAATQQAWRAFENKQEAEAKRLAEVVAAAAKVAKADDAAKVAAAIGAQEEAIAGAQREKARREAEAEAAEAEALAAAEEEARLALEAATAAAERLATDTAAADAEDAVAEEAMVMVNVDEDCVIAEQQAKVAASAEEHIAVMGEKVSAALAHLAAEAKQQDELLLQHEAEAEVQAVDLKASAAQQSDESTNSFSAHDSSSFLASANRGVTCDDVSAQLTPRLQAAPNARSRVSFGSPVATPSSASAHCAQVSPAVSDASECPSTKRLLGKAEIVEEELEPSTGSNRGHQIPFISRMSQRGLRTLLGCILCGCMSTLSDDDAGIEAPGRPMLLVPSDFGFSTDEPAESLRDDPDRAGSAADVVRL